MSMVKKMSCLLAAAVLLSTCPVGGNLKASANTASKTFTVLQYNVAGLPEGLSSGNPSANTVLISPKLNDYDICSVDEDFAYHDQLISKVTSPYLTKTSGNVPFGDGMNLISKLPFYDLDRVKWNKSFGFITNGADQMTPKGFLYTQVEIEAGVYVDYYSFHADADTDSGSEAARRDNLSQIAEYVNTYSKGHAVIIAADTNCRYTRTEDKLLENLVKPCGLTDAWIELDRGGSYPAFGDALMDSTHLNGPDNEVVDKIFYRSGPDVTLKALSYRLENTKFVDSKGNQLSDHYPITATFQYTKNSNITMSELWGGSGGIAFDSLSSKSTTASRPTALTLFSAKRVDSISMQYADGTSQKYGGSGGTGQTLKFANDEYIAKATLYKDKYNGSDRIFYAEFTTNKGNVLAGGTKSGTAITLTAPSGSYICGFFGRAQDEIDKLGVVSSRLPLPNG